MVINLSFFLDNLGLLAQKLGTHLYLCGLAMVIATGLAIPLGVGLTRSPSLRKLILSLASISQTIPSLAAMAILIPIVGIGVTPTLIILAFYAIYPILKNTVVGMCGVPEQTLEAADAMGFSAWQRLYLVEFPLALPNILAGLRIAMAMTIGIATIAAFIGAGGLGDFITQGLALNNMSLVLLGALPAALLALVADFMISLMESWVVDRHRASSALIFMGIGWLALGLILGLSYLLTTSHATSRGSVIVASKNFTEQYILAEIMAQLLEAKTTLNVERKINLGTTDTVHQAMLQGDVDIYPEYTGTAYVTVLQKNQSRDAARVFEEVSTGYRGLFDLIWLKPFGFANSQTLAVTKELAKKYSLKNLSDLSAIAPQLIIAAPAEFMQRADAFPGLKKIYGLNFKSIKQMDPNLMYNAISHQKVDLMVAFATDGKLKKWDLVALVDDKNFAPPYDAAPIIRGALLRSHPEIAQILGQLAGQIDQSTMANLNALVDLEGLSPYAAAHKFLWERGLIQ